MEKRCEEGSRNEKSNDTRASMLSLFPQHRSNDFYFLLAAVHSSLFLRELLKRLNLFRDPNPSRRELSTQSNVRFFTYFNNLVTFK